MLVAQVTDQELQDKEVMLVMDDEGLPALEDVAHRDGVLCMDKIPYQVENQELPEVCMLL